MPARSPETIAPTESVAVPGTSGLTARPVLLAASLVSPIGQGSNQIDYTFSIPITTVDGDPHNLVAVMSNGQEVRATGGDHDRAQHGSGNVCHSSDWS